MYSRMATNNMHSFIGNICVNLTVNLGLDNFFFFHWRYILAQSGYRWKRSSQSIQPGKYSRNHFLKLYSCFQLWYQLSKASQYSETRTTFGLSQPLIQTWKRNQDIPLPTTPSEQNWNQNVIGVIFLCNVKYHSQRQTGSSWFKLSCLLWVHRGREARTQFLCMSDDRNYWHVKLVLSLCFCSAPVSFGCLFDFSSVEEREEYSHKRMQQYP